MYNDTQVRALGKDPKERKQKSKKHMEDIVKARQILNLVSFIGVVIINGLSTSLPLNGKTPKEISDMFPVLFTPAGYVFSIWGLIYLLLAGFNIYQILPSQRNNPRLERIGYWFVLSSIFNASWIFLWHYGFFTLTLFAMLGLLVSLLVIYQRLEIGKVNVSLREKILVNLPFSVYLGWISVATIANASVTLYNLGWNGFGFPALWTVLVLLVASAIGTAMLLLRRDYAFVLVLVWAFIGIMVEQRETTPVVVAAGALAAVLGLIVLVRFFRSTSPRVHSQVS